MGNNQSEQKVEWQTATEVKLCTFNQCLNGHTWAAQIQVVPCPGCKASVLVGRMVQCPQCNEPTAQLTLRTDHLSNGGIVAHCLGHKNEAEVMRVVMERHHWQEAESGAAENAVIEHGKRIGN